MADEKLRPPPLSQREDRRPNPLVGVKLPLWVTLLVAVVILLLFLFLLASRKQVDLGPSIKGSDISVCALLPDASPKFNPADAERDITKALTDLGAKSATARVQRPPDTCPSIPVPVP